jgi:S1-C subfamily serine protease
VLGALALAASQPAVADHAVATIERVKASIVAVGTSEPTRAPAFQFRATGFAIGDGSLIATNAHALPIALDRERRETLVIAIPRAGREPQIREAREVAVDIDTDLAVLRIGGQPLPALKLADLASAREGQSVLFTGFPIGSVLGIFAATHRGMIAAITPIVIPANRATTLNPQVVRRLAAGSFPVLQLDGTAYPGNSGSPVYDPDSGEVLGIINMTLVKGTKEAALTDPSRIAYAIPAQHLQALMAKAR